MIRHAVTALDRAIEALACVLVIALLTCVTLGVVTRAWGDPLIWTDEIARFLMIWLAVFGWILASRKQMHVRIRYFQDHLPPRMHRAVELVIQLALSLFGALLTWFGIGLVAKNHDLDATSLPISMAWMYVPIVLAGLVTALQGACDAFAIARQLRSRASSRAQGDRR